MKKILRNLVVCAASSVVFVAPLAAQENGSPLERLQQLSKERKSLVAEQQQLRAETADIARRMVAGRARQHSYFDWALLMLDAMNSKATKTDPKLTSAAWMEAIHKKAVAGDVDSGYVYGMARFFGFSVAQGPDAEIAKYVQAAAEKGKPEAVRDLAVLTWYGTGVKQDAAAAFALAQRAAELSPSGKALLGYFYVQGSGTEKNIEKGGPMLAAAADAGDPLGQYFIGDYTRKDKPEFSAHFLQLAIDQGESRSMVMLALMKINGEGIPKDENGALYLAEEAAALGEPYARWMCSQFFIEGTMTAPKNEAAGRVFLDAAAKDGEEHAQYELGRLLFMGQGGYTEDKKTGLDWMLNSAKQGNEEATKTLQKLIETNKPKQ